MTSVTISIDLRGFVAGVLRVEWTGESFEAGGRRVYMAQIVECGTPGERLPREAVSAALVGLVVCGPDGTLSRITGLESFAITHLGTGTRGEIGLLLVPLTSEG